MCSYHAHVFDLVSLSKRWRTNASGALFSLKERISPCGYLIRIWPLNWIRFDTFYFGIYTSCSFSFRSREIINPLYQLWNNLFIFWYNILNLLSSQLSIMRCLLMQQSWRFILESRTTHFRNLFCFIRGMYFFLPPFTYHCTNQNERKIPLFFKYVYLFKARL